MELIPYANIIGSLMYAMICTRPNVALAVSVTSRFMSDFGREHWSALRWLLRYIKGASDLGILYDGNKEHGGDVIVGYSDSDFAGNIDNRRSQTGYVSLCLDLL